MTLVRCAYGGSVFLSILGLTWAPLTKNVVAITQILGALQAQLTSAPLGSTARG